MLQRGRKSPEALAAVRVLPGDRPRPPDYLRAEEALMWREIVASLPADYFRIADQLLLVAYVQQFACYREAMQLTTEVPAKDVAALHRIATRALRSVLALATKLRLTPQSRYGPRAADTATRASGPKPWRR